MKYHFSRRILPALTAVVLLFLLFIAFLRFSQTVPAEYALPVLMYHHVVTDSEDCNSVTVTVSRLEMDFQWLKKNDYTPVLPRELAAGEPLPEKPVVITFDDGYRSNYELVFPLMKKYQIKAAIALITSMADVEKPGFLTWEMCREMTESGLVEIGSHTHTLHNSETLGNFVTDGVNGIQRRPEESDGEFRVRVLEDLQTSHDRIAEELGTEVTYFAYPYGVTEPDAEKLIHALYPVTAVTGNKLADRRSGLHEITRLNVNMDRELSEIL